MVEADANESIHMGIIRGNALGNDGHCPDFSSGGSPSVDDRGSAPCNRRFWPSNLCVDFRPVKRRTDSVALGRAFGNMHGLVPAVLFSAVQLTGVAIGTVVAIGSAPAFSGILEALILKRKPDRVWVFSSVLSVAGCILLFANRDSYIVDPFGVGLGLLAGLAFAGYAMFSKNVLGLMEVVPAVAVIFSLSGLGLVPFLFFLDTGYLALPQNLMIVAYLGLAATSLAYLLFSSGLKAIPSSSAVTLSLAEPLTASVLGVAIVGEALSGQSWVGVALLIGGIALLAFGKNAKLKNFFRI